MFKHLESPLDYEEIQPVHPKGDQPSVFFGRNDAKAETPVLWPPHARIWLIGKDPDAGRDWGQEEKGMTDKMAGWMALPTQCTWVWVNSRSWWWTERPGMLWFMGLQRVRRDWATELNWKHDIHVLKINDDYMQHLKLKHTWEWRKASSWRLHILYNSI